MNFRLYLFALLMSFFTGSVEAQVKVVTSIPEFAWLFKEVGKSDVEVSSLLKGDEDPHYVDAKPSFILQASRADLFCFVGLALEIGWLPKVIEASGNQRIQINTPGYCDLSKSVQVIGKHEAAVDRSMGHLHPEGNPHYWVSAKVMAELTKEVAAHLSSFLPEKEPEFSKRAEVLKQKILNLRQQKRKAFSNKKYQILQYHSEFEYWLKDLGLQLLDYTIEEKPGVSPSASSLTKTAKRAKNEGVDLCIAAKTSSDNQLKAFERLSGIPCARLPTMSSSGNFLELYDLLAEEVLTKLKLQTRHDPTKG